MNRRRFLCESTASFACVGNVFPAPYDLVIVMVELSSLIALVLPLSRTNRDQPLRFDSEFRPSTKHPAQGSIPRRAMGGRRSDLAVSAPSVPATTASRAWVPGQKPAAAEVLSSCKGRTARLPGV